jgi:hypothetical protein
MQFGVEQQDRGGQVVEQQTVQCVVDGHGPVGWPEEVEISAMRHCGAIKYLPARSKPMLGKYDKSHQIGLGTP